MSKILPVFLFLICSTLTAQNVEVTTLISNIDASGGLTRDAEGNIYVSDFGPGGSVDSNTIVYKIDKDDLTLTEFADGFIGASGACFDSQGNFYQANNNGNRISRIDANGVKDLDWATGEFNVPIGVIADSEDNIFVCNCGSNSISKITQEAEISTFATSSLFNCPNGLTIDPEDNLYACNFSDGKVLKITPDGEVSELAELPALSGGPNLVGNGHITYLNDYLYVNLIGRGQVYRICTSGETELIAGQAFGFSNEDGPALSATFSKPNGIIASITGDTLFVNCSDPAWPTDPVGLHPARVRMITGINSLPDALCDVPSNTVRFSQIEEGAIVTGLTISLGSSWGDYDNDGDQDVFVSVGSGNNRLFRNNGDLTFTLVSGVVSNDGGSSSSSIWGDYNNDGFLDLYVSNNPSLPNAAESNFLYRNEGPPDFAFTRILTESPVTEANYTWSSSWVDYDLDGDLDLHVPDNKHEQADLFFENSGSPDINGQYFTLTQPPFVTGEVESTGVASWMDYDNDCDPDLFMIKSGRTHPDGGEDNRMYHNTFQETGILDFLRVTTADMVNHFDKDFQASWGDYDNDGDMDVYLGNFDAPNYLYRNEGDSLFTQINEGSPVEDNTATLGSSWGDYDNDGDLDLFVGNTLGQPCAYYENDGQGGFTKKGGGEIGPPVVNLSNTQSCSNADLNNDGYLDLFVANSAISQTQLSPDFLYLNNGGENGYMLLTLQGVNSNRSAIGAKVRIKATIGGEEKWQMRVVSGSPTGDRAQNSLRVHFGIGNAAIIDSLIIEWPSCQKDTFVMVDPNQDCTVLEDGSTTCEWIGSTSTIEELDEGTFFELVPNPASGKEVLIRYQLPESSPVRLALFDLQGKLIRQKAIPDTGPYNLDLSGLAAGMYIIRLQTDRGSQSKKLILP